MNASSLGDTRSKRTIPCLNKMYSPAIKYTLKIYKILVGNQLISMCYYIVYLKGFIKINKFSGQTENASTQTKGLYRRQFD